MTDRISPGQGDSDEEALAARAAARLLQAEIAALDPPAESAVSRLALWNHSRRERGDPIDFAVERALRTDSAAAALYRKLLAMRAVGASEFAAAAYDSSATHRRLGDFTLDVVEEDDAPPALVIRCLSDAAAPPTMIEAVSIEGVVRLALPEAVNGHIVLDLPRHDPERDLLRLTLANPLAGVYLL